MIPQRLILGLLIAFGLVVAVLLFRPQPAPTPTPITPATASDPVAPAAEARPRLATAGMPRPAGHPEPSGPELPAPNLAALRPEREALFQELTAETNALLAEVQTAIGPLQTSDPASLATAWSLANNWGIFLKGESTADQRIEDPAMREQLAALHRRVLVEATEKELQALVGKPIPPEVLASLESLGRQHQQTSRVRNPAPTAEQAAAKAAAEARRKAAAASE